MRACRDDERFSVEAARLNETVGSTPAIAIYSWLVLADQNSSHRRWRHGFEYIKTEGLSGIA